MTETIMQCCYTNATEEIGGKISSGWHPVAVSDNIPSDAYNSCVNLQSANSTIQSQMTDERGNVLNLFEITGDGSYVYVSRAQYGMVDRLGRPNMFSHAYIFSWKREEIISDPNSFLTLDKSNFADNEETAAAAKDCLVRTPAFTLSTAMEKAGLNGETYLTLIRCVFSQFSERKAAKPLFISYDGTLEQMQAILYCIYWGLPYGIRRNLSVASAVSNTSDSKNIIFSEFASKHESYLIPQTGENNLLTPRTERKIARNGFVDHAVRNFDSMDMNAYFAQLDKLAAELGDPAASNELILKLAHQMMEDTDLSALTEEELDARLSDALRSKTYGSQRMEEYISRMLDEVRSRKMFLTEESEANLADRLTAPATERLASAGEQYNIYRFSTLSVEEASKLLTRMPDSIFTRYSHTLSGSAKGLQILDQYYSQYALSGKLITWEVLNNLLAETSYMSSRRKTTDLIDAKAWDLYYTLITKKGEALQAFDDLMALLSALYGDTNQVRHAQYVQSARDAYWDRKSVESFAYADLEEYKAMSVDESPKCALFAHMFSVLDGFRSDGEDRFLALLNSLFILFQRDIAVSRLANPILDAIERELQAFCPNPAYLTKWMLLASVTETKEMFKQILLLKNSQRARSYDVFTEAYRKVSDAASFVRTGATLMKLLSTTLVEECTKMDREEAPIPLDVWILLGSSQYVNSFELFDNLTPPPQILQVTEASVATESTLLAKAPYAEQAEEYAQGKGAEAKTVRKWLNEVKAAEKRRRAEEKKAQAEAEGRGMFSFLPFGNKDAKPKAEAEPEITPAEDTKQPEKKSLFKFGRK